MTKSDGAVKLDSEILTQVFANVPVALRVEDCTALHKHLDELRRLGNADLERYFLEHPDELERCAGMVQTVDANRSALGLYRAASLDELLENPVCRAIGDTQTLSRVVLNGLAQDRTRFSIEASVCAADGRKLPVRLDGTVLPETADGRRFAVVALTDVSEQRSAELQLRQSHDSQMTLNALLSLALEDLELDELVRRALALVLGNPWPATLGVGAVFLADDEARELVLEAHNGISAPILERCARVPFGHCLCGQVAMTGRPLYSGWVDERHEITYAGISPHGHYCVPIAAGEMNLGVLNVYLAQGHPRDLHEERFLTAFASTLAGIIVRKRTEQSFRQADEQLREQAALTRLGEMAAVVAHEVRNPLAAVRGAIQIIGGRLPPSSKDAAIVGEIIGRIDGLNELMKDLLLFARPPQAHPVPVDVAALASETAVLLKEDPTARDLQVVVEGSSAAVMADAKLLKIVLLNLLVNAAHAMERKGTICVSVTTDDRLCRIEVADTGPGIPPQVRERIFTPFFTTKARGTGLGLTTAKRLVEAHRGRIAVECPTSGGTTVTIELPR